MKKQLIPAYGFCCPRATLQGHSLVGWAYQIDSSKKEKELKYFITIDRRIWIDDKDVFLPVLDGLSKINCVVGIGYSIGTRITFLYSVCLDSNGKASRSTPVYQKPLLKYDFSGVELTGYEKYFGSLLDELKDRKLLEGQVKIEEARHKDVAKSRDEYGKRMKALDKFEKRALRANIRVNQVYKQSQTRTAHPIP